MNHVLTLDAARQLVAEKGTRPAQELYRKTFDPALAEAIAEKFDEKADAFSRQQREIRQVKQTLKPSEQKK